MLTKKESLRVGFLVLPPILARGDPRQEGRGGGRAPQRQGQVSGPS
jgi:hypothetical protein